MILKVDLSFDLIVVLFQQLIYPNIETHMIAVSEIIFAVAEIRGGVTYDLNFALYGVRFLSIQFATVRRGQLLQSVMVLVSLEHNHLWCGLFRAHWRIYR